MTNNNYGLVETRLAEARSRLANIERGRAEQPTKLAEIRKQTETERDWAHVEEPWSTTLATIPTHNVDGDSTEPDGSLVIPTVYAKDLWGCRLAFDAASSEELAIDVVSAYLSEIGDTNQAMTVFAAAITTLVDLVIKPMLDVVEERASDYEMRVNLADAARNAWATRTTMGEE